MSFERSDHRVQGVPQVSDFILAVLRHLEQLRMHLLIRVEVVRNQAMGLYGQARQRSDDAVEKRQGQSHSQQQHDHGHPATDGQEQIQLRFHVDRQALPC